MNRRSAARYWALAAALSASTLTLPGIASAEPLPDQCTQAEATGPVTCTYTVGTTALTLPEGVTSVQVTAIGGRGGSSDEALTLGGRGATITATVTVPAATRTLYAVVGENGGDSGFPSTQVGVGGANGGGNGGLLEPGRFLAGAGGGGASDVRTDSTDLSTRLVVAAGGGGSAGTRGADAGASGPGTYAGGAGSRTAGGAAGASSGAPSERDATTGMFGVGGAGAYSSRYAVGGGGGGGGWYGGGGGGIESPASGTGPIYVGSGGGGSSLTPNGEPVELTTDPPSVTIVYLPPSTPQPPVCTGSACLPAGLLGSS